MGCNPAPRGEQRSTHRAVNQSTLLQLLRLIHEVCRELSLCARGHSVNDGKDWYKVFCFAEPELAATFMARFSGESFDPKQRGRGARWAQWRRGDV